MKTYLKLLLSGLLVFALAMGCKKKDEVEPTQPVAPASAGERGTSCDAKNDCEDGLSCFMGLCQPANFSVDATMKECYRKDCESVDDCCGERNTDPPAKCRNRELICDFSELPGCTTDFGACTTAADCDGDAVCTGNRFCTLTGGLCTGDADCQTETCEFPTGMGGAGTLGQCTLTLSTCTEDADCTYNSNTCGTGNCSCDNPDYDPFADICTDPDCDDVCTLVCNENRCVEDTSCESNDDCIANGSRDICDRESGECVECESNSDCDDPNDEGDNDDRCSDTGTCYRPCEGDAECGMFQACQNDGTCEFVGCRSDNECILTGQGAGPGDDNRLLTCVINDEGMGTCAVECELDAQCPQNQTCEDGSCKMIGCDQHSDCYAIQGLHGWERDEFTPWTPELLCLAPEQAEDGLDGISSSSSSGDTANE